MTMNEQSNMNREIREELESVAPELARLKRQDPGEPPEGYFERLPDIMASRVSDENKHGRRIRIFRISMAAAAAVALAVILFRPVSTSVDGEINLTNDEIYYYLSSNAGDLESGDLYALLGPESETDLEFMFGNDEMKGLLDVLTEEMDEETLNTILESQIQ